MIRDPGNGARYPGSRMALDLSDTALRGRDLVVPWFYGGSIAWTDDFKNGRE
jgi:hypothetical protein